MKIRMLSLAAGPKGVWPPGSEIDLPDAEAIALIESKVAVPIVTQPERAVVSPPEQRTAAKDEPIRNKKR